MIEDLWWLAAGQLSAVGTCGCFWYNLYPLWCPRISWEIHFSLQAMYVLWCSGACRATLEALCFREKTAGVPSVNCTRRTIGAPPLGWRVWEFWLVKPRKQPHGSIRDGHAHVICTSLALSLCSERQLDFWAFYVEPSVLTISPSHSLHPDIIQYLHIM